MTKDLLQLYKDLFIPSPSGTEKLLAAWDDLSFKDKLIAFKLIEKNQYPHYLRQKIYNKALISSNSYIRYIAVKNFEFDENNPEHKLFKEKISSDSSPLVRFAHLESTSGLFEHFQELTAEKFYSLPHAAKLATVRAVCGEGGIFARLIKESPKYIKENKISDEEVREIITDYLLSPGFISSYVEEQPLSYDGLDEYSTRKDLQDLWTLIIELPQNLTFPLLMYLPESVGNESSSDIPLLVLEKLSKSQIYILLNRENIQLLEFRKKILSFYKDNNLVRDAALSHCLNFTLEEFENSLPSIFLNNNNFKNLNFNDDEKIKLDILDSLGLSAQDLDWVYYAILKDILFLLPYIENAAYPQMTFEQKLHSVKNKPLTHTIKKQLIKIKLYYLAKEVVPWHIEEKGFMPASFNHKLKFLKKGIVLQSTWKTFRNFIEIWENASNLDEYYKLLPNLYDYDDNERHISENYTEGLINLGSNKVELDLTSLDYKINNLEKNIEQSKQNITTLFVFILILLILILWKVH